jgi:predicted RNase H-like HicB family nuclease
MLFEYIQSALKYAEYKKLDDHTWFAEIPNFTGVWANGKSIEECRTELAEVLEEWILLKIRDDEKVPDVDGLKIEMKVEEILSPC